MSPLPLIPANTPLGKLPDFDPKRVPVIGVDADLPAVPAAQLTPEALRRRFSAPPLWTPEVWLERRFTDRAMADASVLVPIVLRPRPTVLLTERTTHLSTHSGQVAFPGGRADPGDANAAATALREAWEEIGLPDSAAEVLGALPTYTTGTAFVVTPVVAFIQPQFVARPNPYEVAEVFEVPLDFLMNPAHHRRHAFEWEAVDGHQLREWFSMPYRDGEAERFIWGATAGMLRNFYRFLIA